MLKKILFAIAITLVPLSSFSCGVGSVAKTIDRVTEATKNGDTAEVERTVKAVVAGALGGAGLGAVAAPMTFGAAPVVGAVMGAACGCAVANKTAPVN